MTAARFAAPLIASLLLVPAVSTRAYAEKSFTEQVRTAVKDVKKEVGQAAKEAQIHVESAKAKTKKALATTRNIYRGLTNQPPKPTIAAGSSAPAPAASVATLGSFAVAEQTLTFTDATRRTEASGSNATAPQRSLETLILSPSGDGAVGRSFPLVVFAHGLGANPGRYKDLLKPFASAGYVVAAPKFPVSSRAAKSNAEVLVGLVSETEQPADIRFVIDQMLMLSTPGAPMAGLIDPARVAVAGHSLGATTVLDLGFNECCTDPRVRAVVSISGIQNLTRTGAFFTRTPVPLLLIHGNEDPVVPYVGSRFAYEGAGSPKALLTIVGGDHTFGLTGKPGTSALVGGLTIQAMVDFFDRYVKDASDGIDRLRGLVASQPQILMLDTK